MSLTERIETLLVGNATGLVNTFKEGGSASDAFAAKTTSTGRLMEKLGLQGLSTGDMISKGLQVGAASGAVAIGALALKGVQQFSDMTATVRGFQRVIGGTAEDSSRLAAATQRMGIDAGTAETAFGQLAKRIGENKDTLAQWGVEIARNKDGSVNFSKTLENISEKYISIKDPAERAAFASENFGKGFQGINALLGQGKDNLQQFYDIAAKHHEIFSQDDLQKGLDFSRAMKDLQTAIQGLELEAGRALIPVLTGTAQILTTVVEALDSFTQSGDGASLAMAGLAAGLALAFGGPVWAVAAATIIGVTTALGDNAAAAKVTADAEEALAKKIDMLSAKQAVAAFDAYIQKAAEFVPAVDSMAGRLKAFRDIANDSPAAGQKLIDTWKAGGAAVGPYEQALAGVVERHKEQKKNADLAASANDQLTGSQNQSTGAIAATSGAVKEYVTALDAQKKALDAVQSALLAQQGGEIGRQQALINVTTAQQAYTDAVNQYGTDSPQAVAASLALQQAHLGVVDATDKANQATEDLNTKFKDPAAVQSEIDRLQDLINKYGDADGSIQAQIDKLHAYQFTLAQTPPAVATTVSIDGLDDALYKVGALQQQLGYLTSHDWAIAVNIMGNASAPHTG